MQDLAGTSAQFLGREGKYALMRMRSGEVRKIHLDCRVTIGEVGNEEHGLRKLGKAGAKRWRGIRPTVRGVAMNPVDHPHGGGEGRNFWWPPSGFTMGSTDQRVPHASQSANWQHDHSTFRQTKIKSEASK